MVPTGIDAGLELQISNRRVVPLGEILLYEDLREGTRLRFLMDAEAVSPPALGASIRLDITPWSTSESAKVTHPLWCYSSEVVGDGRSTSLFIEACDPLAFANGEQVFRTMPGRTPLLQLVRRVLGPIINQFEEPPEIATDSPTVPLEWLLQCQESEAEFLRRMAATTGHILFWDRGGLLAAPVGRQPRAGGTRIDLHFGEELQLVRQIQAPDLNSMRLHWVDAGTRSCTPLELRGNGLGRATERLPGRIPSVTRPFPVVHVGTVNQRGAKSIVDTTRADVRLGDCVRLPSGEIGIVERIEHFLDSLGSYRNSMTCVRPERWGMVPRPSRIGTVGPFQAEITHNDDPLGQGRIRVLLSEDVDRRPTPWIPCLGFAAGDGTGSHWLPEVGEIGLVLAEADCPEALYCVGSMRGRNQKAHQEWQSRRNAVKALRTPGGLSIQLDDEKKSIRIGSADSFIELKGRDIRIVSEGGTFTVRGDHLVLDPVQRLDLAP